MAKTSKSTLANRKAKAWVGHANDETDYGQDFSALPPGVKGVAKFDSYSIKEYKSGANQGQEFIRLVGIIQEPEEHTYVPQTYDADEDKVVNLRPTTERVKGRQTALMFPLCDTTTQAGKVTPVGDHVAAVLNEMRKLGADTSEVESQDDAVALLDVLVEEAPAFRFSTRAGKPSKAYPDPTVFESWFGSEGLEDYEPVIEDGIIDDTEGEGTTEEPDDDDEAGDEGDADLESLGEAADNDDEDAQTQLTELAEAQGVDPNDFDTWTEVAIVLGDDQDASEDENEGEDEDEEADLAALGEAADEEDGDAQGQLTALAEEAGLDPDDYGTWTELAEALVGDEGGDDGEGFEPEKNQLLQYKPKGKKALVDVVVTVVNKGKETCNVRNLDDSTLYKDVAWTQLVEPTD